MFGYVVINKPEIKLTDFDLYRSYYCGLCMDLKDNFGLKGRLTLNYDLTFLAIFLDGLYEDNTTVSECRCIAHPFSKHKTRRNEYTDYASEMNILLTYYQCLDDWKDDKNRKKRRIAKGLKSRALKVMEKYPEKSKRIEEELKKLSDYENAGEENIDLTAGCFGRIMTELFLYKEDEWKTYLEKVGFFLGKFVYILDAYCDFESDKEKGQFNALKGIGNDRETIREILALTMSECTRNYEMLPIVENNDILQNILYSGVWTGFEMGSTPKRDRENI